MVTPRWLALAQQELGVAEIPGAQHNPRVVDYFRRAGWGQIVDDETAWCAAFASAILRDAGAPSPLTVRARDFLNWGFILNSPIPGCIVVLKRGTSQATGHVTFFERFSDDGSHILGLGGNQSNKVCRSWFKVSDVLGYRWPYAEIDEPEPQTVSHAETAPPRTELPPRPNPQIPPQEDWQVVEQRLRDNGSRIVTAADKSELHAKGLATTGIGAVVTAVISSFTDWYNALSPLVPVIGLSVLGTLALVFAVYTIREQRQIRAARIEDDINGLHLGRKTACVHTPSGDVVCGEVDVAGQQG